MRFVSTRGEAPPASLQQAIEAGMAPDGGLYLPERLAPFATAELDGLRHLTQPQIAARVLSQVLEGDLDLPALAAMSAAALDFPIPLVEIEPGVRVLELFHGPTLAFKDVAARFLARLLVQHRTPATPRRTVLVATSGDTGAAVAQAFHRLAGTRVVLLYPRGRVSPLQERQLTTLGENVETLAVEGTFDDCQRLVKGAFADADLRRRVDLVSANSINLGRLLPQMVHYFLATAQLDPALPPPLFSVPCGNLGNLTAGLLAYRLGLPSAGFVAATNANDFLPVYLATGRHAPRPSRATLSNAMDVGDPSNFERLHALYGGDRAAMRRDIEGRSYDDGDTRRAIAQVYRRTGYVLDPHTAVGYLGLVDALAQRGGNAGGVLLATAHPAKFPELVEPLIGRRIELPERLSRCLDLPVLARPLRAEPAALRALLLAR